MNKRNNWIKYKTETGLECAYQFKGKIEETRVKIITGVSRRYYKEAINEALEYFEKNIIPILKNKI